MARGGMAALALVLAACGDDAPARIEHMFDEITDSVLPGEQPVALDPTEWACDVICIGAQFGVGAASADVDGDGRLDLYLAGPDGGRLLLNRWPTFERATIGSDGYVHGAAFGDLDGDGDPDLLLATATGLRVFENRGGQLVERVELAHTLGRTASITVGDLNNDGVLDVHVSEYGIAGTTTSTTGGGLLWLGRGDFTFVDAAPALAPRHAWSSLMADIDRDGNLDLFIAAETWLSDPGEQHSSLYFNDGSDDQGQPHLDDQVMAPTLARYSAPMGGAAGDTDGDGEVELLVGLIGPSLFLDHMAGKPARELTGTSYFGPQSREESAHTSWAVAFEDFDRDGHVDGLLAGGAPCVPDICNMTEIPISQSSVLYRFDGDRFDFEHAQPVPNAGGLAPKDAASFRGARGIVLADLDGDGRDELLLTPFRDRFRLYRNVVDRGHSLRVELHGTVSAPAPYGAEVTVVAGGRTRWRSLVSGGSTHSQSPPALGFELGDATKAERVEIRWPSGLRQTLTDVAAGVLRADEPHFLEIPARALAVGVEWVVFVQRSTPNDDPTGIDLRASDGVAFTLEALGGGRFRAHRPGPTVPGPVRLTLTLDGFESRTRPIIWFR